ncbi:MAG: hypothetical protein QOG64_793 [Acidimicrobiaceae bacterium]|nr:hypothetical protein [Acidimicrobiaceae bacterium]
MAGSVGAIASGGQNTLWSLARRENLLVSTAAIGAAVLPNHSPRPVLLAAGVAGHGAISWTWSILLARLLPRRPSLAAGAAAGLAIAALDLGIIGRRLPSIRGLAPIPQVLDHVAYGVTVAAVLRVMRTATPGGGTG